MGIYDREYYREGTDGFGWLSGVSPVCKALILVNVAAFVAQIFIPPLTDYLRVSSPAIFEGLQVYRLLTGAFLHDPRDPLHLVFNMLFLWVAGRDMESMYGGREFCRMYLAAAVLSNLVWAGLNYLGPDHGFGAALGASGAVWAVMVLYTMYYPRREILLAFVLPVPMWLVLVIYLGYDGISLVQKMQGITSAGVGTAVAAHLGGAAYGFLYKTYDLRWSRLDWPARRPRLRVVRSEGPIRDREPSTTAAAAGRAYSTAASARVAPTSVIAEEQLDARVDEILAKIARDGRSSVTEEENRLLQEASRRARDRRADRVR